MLFGKKFDKHKCKSNLKMGVTRIVLQKQKTQNSIKVAKRQIADLLRQQKYDSARIKVENLIREDYMIEAFELLEVFCDLIHSRLQLIEESTTCPYDLREAVSTVIYATPRIEIPEFQEIRNQLTIKYGKEFAQEASENKNLAVNQRVMFKLGVKVPEPYLCVQYLKEIAAENNVPWDSDSILLPEDVPAVTAPIVPTTTVYEMPPIPASLASLNENNFDNGPGNNNFNNGPGNNNFRGNNNNFGGPGNNDNFNNFGGPSNNFNNGPGNNNFNNGPGNNNFRGNNNNFGGGNNDNFNNFGGPSNNFNNGPGNNNFRGNNNNFGGPGNNDNFNNFGGPSNNFNNGPGNNFKGNNDNFDDINDINGPGNNNFRGNNNNFGGGNNDNFNNFGGPSNNFNNGPQKPNQNNMFSVELDNQFQTKQGPPTFNEEDDLPVIPKNPPSDDTLSNDFDELQARFEALKRRD